MNIYAEKMLMEEWTRKVRVFAENVKKQEKKAEKEYHKKQSCD